MRYDVDGRVALVTGAGSGIGQAAADLLADQGATVIYLDIDEAAATRAAAGARERGGSAEGWAADAGSLADWQRVVAEVEVRYGRLDLLFNNAGYTVNKEVVDLGEEELDGLIRVMLVGTLLGCKTTIPAMLRGGGGAIVNNASTHGLLGFPRVPGYAAAKGGIIAATRQMAADYAQRDVRINCVCPGPTLTPRMRQRIAERATDPRQQLARVPIGRYASPGEIAAAVVFLLSPAASYVTGAALVVDGGQSSSRAFYQAVEAEV